MDKHLHRLLDLRDMLDRNIQMLQVRSARQGNLTVHKTVLPRQVCFVRRYSCADVAEAANKLRDTYIAAARTGKMSMVGRMFTMRMTPEPGILDLMCCIPVDNDFDGPERMEFAEAPALCIYYRGPYEGTATAIRALMEHIREKGIETTGPFRAHLSGGAAQPGRTQRRLHHPGRRAGQSFAGRVAMPSGPDPCQSASARPRWGSALPAPRLSFLLETMVF